MSALAEFWCDLWGDAVGRFVVLLMVGTMAVLVGLIVYAAHHPDPPGTTYTYEPTTQCQAVVGANGQVSVVCVPSYIAVPHYPTATRTGK